MENNKTRNLTGILEEVCFYDSQNDGEGILSLKEKVKVGGYDIEDLLQTQEFSELERGFLLTILYETANEKGGRQDMIGKEMRESEFGYFAGSFKEIEKLERNQGWYSSFKIVRGAYGNALKGAINVGVVGEVHGNALKGAINVGVVGEVYGNALKGAINVGEIKDDRRTIKTGIL